MEKNKQEFITNILEQVNHLRTLVSRAIGKNVNFDVNGFANMLSKEYDRLELRFKNKYEKKENN